MLSDDTARGYLLQIEDLVQDAIDHPRPLHRPPSRDELYANGPPDIEVGTLVHAPDVRFGLRFRDSPRGVLITGNSGSGKTTLERVIITEADKFSYSHPDEHVSMIMLPTKGDVTDLHGKLKCPCTLLSVHDPGTRLSIGAPIGMPANPWINIVTTIFCACAGMIAAWTCLANMIRWLLAALNPEKREPLTWPSLQLLLDVAIAAPLWLWAAKPDYEKTLIGKLEGAIPATDVFDCFAGFDVERDVVRPRRHLIFEMPNVMPAWVRRFIQYLLIAQVLYGRIHRHQKMDGTQVMFVLDEMDQDATLEADSRFEDNMSTLAQVIRQGREYGIMPVVGMSRLSHASPYVRVDSVYQFLFNQSDYYSVRAARETVNLSPAADQMFPGLPRGICIAREAQGPWSRPMEVKVDHIAPGRGGRPESYDTHPQIPAKRLDELPDVQRALDSLVASRRKASLRHARTERAQLSAEAHKLLDAAARHPWAPAATLWKSLGKVPPQAKQRQVRKELAAWKLAESELPRIGQTQVLLYSITEAGWDILPLERPKHQGGGSITHQHVSHWIAQCGAADGHAAQIEWAPPGCDHRADCALEVAPGVFDVFEVVVTSTENVLAHLTALEPCEAIRRITVVCLEKQKSKALCGQLTGAPVMWRLGDRLGWDAADTYLRRCFP